MWVIDPGLLVALIGLVVAYAGASWLLGKQPTSHQAGAYMFGVLSIFFALSGPIDQLTSDRLFTAYILQQMILVLVAAPFLLMGLPDWMLRPVFTNRWLRPFWRVMTRPVVTFLTFSLVFTLIHYPPVCDRICHLQQFYASIRVILVIAGLLLWWPLFSPLEEFPPLPYPMQIMYLFLLSIPMTAVAAPITLSDSVVYMFYQGGIHPWGLTPIDDQVMGGLLMWIGEMFYLMTVFTVVFIRWAEADNDTAPRRKQRQPAEVRVLQPRDRPAA
ncbi:MAG: cytochrome c oxidase assembly protein [Candidatus Binataceae bacterium]